MPTNRCPELKAKVSGFGSELCLLVLEEAELICGKEAADES